MFTAELSTAVVQDVSISYFHQIPTLPCIRNSVCQCWLSAKQQKILNSASHCYGSHLHFALEAKANTQSLIRLFSPIPGGKRICNFHWLYKASLDKMKTCRENAYAKRNPSSISKAVFQLWEERVSTFWGPDAQPPSLVCLTAHRHGWRLRAACRDAACAAHSTGHAGAAWGCLFHHFCASVGTGLTVQLSIVPGCVRQHLTKR